MVMTYDLLSPPYPENFKDFLGATHVLASTTMTLTVSVLSTGARLILSYRTRAKDVSYFSSLALMYS